MKKQGRALRIVLLVVWVVGILVPLYSVSRLSPSHREVLDWLFHTHMSHVLMHAFLFAVLACLVASFLPHRFRRNGWTTVGSVLLVVLVVAASQEAIQMKSERVPLGPDEIFDIVVDLNGGVLGSLLLLWFSRQKRKSIVEVEQPSEPSNQPRAVDLRVR